MRREIGDQAATARKLRGRQEEPARRGLSENPGDCQPKGTPALTARLIIACSSCGLVANFTSWGIFAAARRWASAIQEVRGR